MELSVVILNYNVCHFLRQCILSVQKAIQEIEAEIIVIDNNSSDGSTEMIKNEFPELLLIENKENIGFGRANNQAVSYAKGKYICILNPDTAVGSDVFIKCLSFIKNTPDCGAIGVRMIDGTGNFLPESKRNLPTPQVSLSKIIWKNKKGHLYYANHLQEKSRGRVSILSGAFMFMKRSLYQSVEGFDRDYFMYGEDIDLSYKIEKKGLSNYYLGDAVILHYKGESTRKDKHYLNRFYGAMHIFYNKHFSTNYFNNALVYIGIEVIKTLKMFSIKEKKRPLPPIDIILFISEDEKFYKKLKHYFTAPVLLASLEDYKKKKLENTMVIWDANYYDYQFILEYMNKDAGKNVLFRIRPEGTEQIIGSDRSDDKGEVIDMKNF